MIKDEEYIKLKEICYNNYNKAMTTKSNDDREIALKSIEVFFKYRKSIIYHYSKD